MVLFVASVKLTSQYRDVMNGRGYVVTTFARTGFANLGSTGIQLEGIGAMAPTRHGDLQRLGCGALLAGFLGTLINACVASTLL